MATREEIAAIKAQQKADLEKKAAEVETATDGGAADEDNTGTDDETTTEENKTEKKVKTSQIDYEAELKKEQERTKAAEDAAADKAFKLRDAKRKLNETDGSADDTDDADKPLTTRQLDERLAAERERTRKELQAEQIAAKAKTLSRSDAEANLIMEIHKNRQWPTYITLDEQLTEAYAIANSKNLVQRNAELTRALQDKNTAGTGDNSTERQGGNSSEPKLPAHDMAAIKASGFVWDGASKLFKKVLNKGPKTLYYDPRNKKRWVQ